MHSYPGILIPAIAMITAGQLCILPFFQHTLHSLKRALTHFKTVYLHVYGIIYSWKAPNICSQKKKELTFCVYAQSHY